MHQSSIIAAHPFYEMLTSQLQIGDVTNSSAIIRDKVRLCIQRGMITRSEVGYVMDILLPGH